MRKNDYIDREEQTRILQKMVDLGWYKLCGDTVEGTIDRDISYGFGVNFAKECFQHFAKLNGQEGIEP